MKLYKRKNPPSVIISELIRAPQLGEILFLFNFLFFAIVVNESYSGY